MIDDETEVSQLIRDMKTHLPIPVYPTAQLSENLREHGKTLCPQEEAHVHSVIDMGDTGGIVCELVWAGGGKDPVLVSLTHLRIDDSHPLAARIKTYQSRRSSRIAMSNSRSTQTLGRRQRQRLLKAAKRRR